MATQSVDKNRIKDISMHSLFIPFFSYMIYLLSHVMSVNCFDLAVSLSFSPHHWLSLVILLVTYAKLITARTVPLIVFKQSITTTVMFVQSFSCAKRRCDYCFNVIKVLCSQIIKWKKAHKSTAQNCFDSAKKQYHFMQY